MIKNLYLVTYSYEKAPDNKGTFWIASVDFIDAVNESNNYISKIMTIHDCEPSLTDISYRGTVLIKDIQ